MRRKVVLWLAGACQGLGMGRHSIHQAINYLDRVCTKYSVAPQHLTKVAAAAILLSSKMQDRVDNEPPYISQILEYDATGDTSCRPPFPGAPAPRLPAPTQLAACRARSSLRGL